MNITLTEIPTRRDDILLILVITSIVLLLVYIQVWQRLLSILLSFLINLHLRNSSSSLHFSSFTYSPLTGRIILYGLRYATISYCFRCKLIRKDRSMDSNLCHTCMYTSSSTIEVMTRIRSMSSLRVGISVRVIFMLIH